MAKSFPVITIGGIQVSQTIVTAPGPLKLTEGGRYSIDFGINVGISKYQFHMPLERQVKQMASRGLEVKSNVLFNQIDTIAFYLKNSFLSRLKTEAKRDPLHIVDETYWNNLGKKEGQNKRFWCWDIRTSRTVVFEIYDSRSQKVASKFLEGISGVLLTDGYKVYQNLSAAKKGHLILATELLNQLAERIRLSPISDSPLTPPMEDHKWAELEIERGRKLPGMEPKKSGSLGGSRGRPKNLSMHFNTKIGYSEIKEIIMNKTQLTLTTSDGPMNAYLSLPDQKEKAPAVIVIQEAFGVNSHIQDVCRRLSKEGYIAISPELFHRSGNGLKFGYGDYEKIKPILGQLTNQAMEIDIAAALKYLTQELKVPAQKVAVLGFCMGGFAAFLAACRLKIGTALSFYGGGMVNPRPGIGFTPLIGEAAKIKIPVLCSFGGKDPAIPPSDVDTIRSTLAKHPELHHEVIVYPEAGHGFFCEERASYHAESARDAWKRILSWLGKMLR